MNGNHTHPREYERISHCKKLQKTAKKTKKGTLAAASGSSRHRWQVSRDNTPHVTEMPNALAVMSSSSVANTAINMPSTVIHDGGHIFENMSPLQVNKTHTSFATPAEYPIESQTASICALPCNENTGEIHVKNEDQEYNSDSIHL